MMTTQDLINYYANLLILQYKGMPNAYTFIQTVVNPVIMNQLPLLVQNAFNLDGTATGVQLDVLGKYAGVSRNQFTLTGPIVLNDGQYYTLILIKIIQNSAGSSLATIQSLLWNAFAGAIRVFDYADMSMDYVIDSSVGSNQLAEVFVTGGFLPKPMGVLLRATIYVPPSTTFFSFRTYQYAAPNNSGFNTYASYAGLGPWLSYKNAIINEV